jgi:hypothetical protein
MNRRDRLCEGLRIVCPITIAQDKAQSDHDVVAQLLRTAWEIAETRGQSGYTRAIETLNYAVERFPDAAPAWALLAGRDPKELFCGTAFSTN